MKKYAKILTNLPEEGTVMPPVRHPKRPGVGKGKDQEPSSAEMKQVKQFMRANPKEDGKQLKEHLSMFNDAVVAIVITIMVLEIPLPTSTGASYLEFLRAIGIFFISFFVVADFWYDLHQLFQRFTEADKTIVVANFVFVASLSLMPIMTKFVMLDHNRLAVINYGITYFVIHLIENVLTYIVLKDSAPDSAVVKALFNRLMMARFWLTFIWNAVLVVLAYEFPSVAMVLYFSLPIISFFFLSAEPKKRGRKNQRN